MNDRHIEPAPQANRVGPLSQAAGRLLESLAAAGVTARFGGGTASEGVDGVLVYPIAVVPETVPGKDDQPLRMRLRCLVCAGGPALAALEALDRILQVQQRFLVPEEPPAGIWKDLGLKAQPGLLFDVPVQFTRTAAPAPRVTGMPTWATVSLGSVAGRVVATGGTPLAGMRISTLDGLVTTHTDPRGNFVLRGVPVPQSAGEPVRLVVAGRGLRFTATVNAEAGTATQEPVVINCEIQEN